MPRQPDICVSFVLDAVAVNQGRAGFVHADDIDDGTFSLELEQNLVKRMYRCDVPKICLSHVNRDAIKRFLEVEGIDERA